MAATAICGGRFGVDLRGASWLYDPAPGGLEFWVPGSAGNARRVLRFCLGLAAMCCCVQGERTIMIGVLMIARAKRVFPGMVMSLLLSAPALAASPAIDKVDHTPHGPANAGSGPQSAPGVRKPAKAVSAQTAQAKKVVSGSGAPAGAKHLVAAAPVPKRVVVARPAPRVVPAVTSSSVMIRRTSGTAGNVRRRIDDGTMWRESGAVTTWQQTGVASWYGGAKWQGHRMSSGARYDESQLTAAHATLPIGTRVRVVLHDSSKFVIVTITDRPGTRTRIIDLSRKAAEQLGILSRGVAMVTLQPV